MFKCKQKKEKKQNSSDKGAVFEVMLNNTHSLTLTVLKIWTNFEK